VVNGNPARRKLLGGHFKVKWKWSRVNIKNFLTSASGWEMHRTGRERKRVTRLETNNKRWPVLWLAHLQQPWRELSSIESGCGPEQVPEDFPEDYIHCPIYMCHTMVWGRSKIDTHLREEHRIRGAEQLVICSNCRYVCAHSVFARHVCNPPVTLVSGGGPGLGRKR